MQKLPNGLIAVLAGALVGVQMSCTAAEVETSPAAANAQASSAQDIYPVVFTDKQTMASIGVQIRFYGPGEDVPAFSNKCKYYGDGGLSMTLSNDLVTPYLARGFTVQSLCMGMQAGIKYEPATGERLATFMIADVATLGRYEFPEAGVLTDELGLEVPTCFAGGRPLSDCYFRFDPKTGAPLNKRALADLQSLEQSADAAARARMKPDFSWEVGPHPQWPVGYLDISDEYTEGYGYALFASGEAGPSADLDAQKIAVDPKRRATRAAIESLIMKVRE